MSLIEPSNSVAVIGMSGRFPGAGSIDELWRNLCAGTESIKRFSLEEIDPSIPESERNHPDYVPVRGVVKSAAAFDASFFGISSREALLMDPQQRLFLETSWTALEDAGCAPSKYEGMVGVYAGMANNTYFQTSVQPNHELVQRFGRFQTMLANEKDFLATRVSHKLNLTGPSISMYTGCSTSLVAIVNAFHSLLNYQCDVAIAGGVCVTYPQNSGYVYREGGIEAVDGHCRPFDAKASGTIFSNGVAVVVLKRLDEAMADGDHIHAIVRGAAMNNDGADKVSFAAPSVQGQAEVISMAQGQADIDPCTVSFIEAHGTATQLGDPIEFEGLKQAFQYPTSGVQHCALGSLKGNFGHLLAAAGVAGFIKAVLALEKRKLPPTINHETINPQIDIENSPFFINTDLLPLDEKGAPLRGGVSSFGIGGTNAHVVLEAAPVSSANEPARPQEQPRLVVVSAKTEESLGEYTEALTASLNQLEPSDLGRASYVMANGREEFDHRTFTVLQDTKEASDNLWQNSAVRSVADKEPDVVLLLPGLGTEYAQLGAGLFAHNEVFRNQVETVSRILNAATGENREAISLLENGGQLGTFACEFALARLLISSGPAPRALVGYSTGELVAAVLADVMSLEDAVAFMIARESVLQSDPVDGAMLAVALESRDVSPHLSNDLLIAAEHSPSLSVVAGTMDAIESMEEKMIQQGVLAKRLPVRGALHTALANIDTSVLETASQKITFAKPKIPMVSTVTGNWMNPAEVTDPTYWSTHHHQPVMLRAALERLAVNDKAVFVEVGPGNSLTTATHQTLAESAILGAIPTLPAEWRNEANETRFFLEAIGQLWLRGVQFSWRELWNADDRQKIKMPTYPFARNSFRLEAKVRAIN